MMKQTLLIIDVQKAMFELGGGIYQGQAVLERIKMLLDRARSKGVPVVFVQHTEDDGPFQGDQALWAIHDLIKPLEDEAVVRKNYWDSFMETTLEDELKKIGTDQLIICGMQTDYCVDTTTRSAFARGYKNNILVSDGHTTFDESYLDAKTIIDHHNNIHGGRFATLMKADSLLC